MRCKVTEYERRKYLTSEEKILAKQIQADKQEELDGNFAEGSAEDTLKRHRLKKEQKARCRVFDGKSGATHSRSSPHHSIP